MKDIKNNKLFQEVIDVINEFPGITDKEIGEKLGISETAVQKRRKRYGIPSSNERKNDIGSCPDGFSIKSVSTLKRFTDEEDGKTILQWTRSVADGSSVIDLIETITKRLSSKITPLHIVESPVSISNGDYLTVYPITDVHLGMRAHVEETGWSYSLDEAVSILCDKMRELVIETPKSKDCLITNLGDFFHFDGVKPQTSRSGHILDVDSPWGKMFMTGFQAFKTMIEFALQNHEYVNVISAKGNHDDVTTVALMVSMYALFYDNERVKIEIPMNPFSYFNFGKVLLGINHGLVKPGQLPMIMAADKKELWGKTLHHYWLCGHTHQKTVWEFPGCVVEFFRAITSKDSWTNSKGYRSEREMLSIRYHKDDGEVGRVIKKIYWE